MRDGVLHLHALDAPLFRRGEADETAGAVLDLDEATVFVGEGDSILVSVFDGLVSCVSAPPLSSATPRRGGQTARRRRRRRSPSSRSPEHPAPGGRSRSFPTARSWGIRRRCPARSRRGWSAVVPTSTSQPKVCPQPKPRPASRAAILELYMRAKPRRSGPGSDRSVDGVREGSARNHVDGVRVHSRIPDTSCSPVAPSRPPSRASSCALVRPPPLAAPAPTFPPPPPAESPSAATSVSAARENGDAGAHSRDRRDIRSRSGASHTPIIKQIKRARPLLVSPPSGKALATRRSLCGRRKYPAIAAPPRPSSTPKPRASLPCSVRRRSTLATRYLAVGEARDLAEALQDGANEERPRDGRVGVHLGEATAFARGHELSPTHAFRIGAAGESAPMHGLRADADAVCWTRGCSSGTPRRCSTMS